MDVSTWTTQTRLMLRRRRGSRQKSRPALGQLALPDGSLLAGGARYAVDEPPAARGRGPEAYYATSLWLREAYADLKWEIHNVVAEGSIVVFHTTMSGRHVKPFVSNDAEGSLCKRSRPRVAPSQPRSRTGSVFRTVGHRHWANRDDLGTATQLGWVPPTLIFLFRMFLATRRARTAARSTS